MSELDTKNPLDISYDTTNSRLVIKTPGGLVVHVEDPATAKSPSDTPDLVITPGEDALRINASQSLSVNSMGKLDLSGQDGVTISSGADVTVVADNDMRLAATETLNIKATDITSEADKTLSGTSGSKSTLTSDGDTVVDGDMIYIG